MIQRFEGVGSNRLVWSYVVPSLSITPVQQYGDTSHLLTPCRPRHTSPGTASVSAPAEPYKNKQFNYVSNACVCFLSGSFICCCSCCFFVFFKYKCILCWMRSTQIHSLHFSSMPRRLVQPMNLNTSSGDDQIFPLLCCLQQEDIICKLAC